LELVLESEVAVFATSDCQAGGFCQLDTNTDENEKGERESLQK